MSFFTAQGLSTAISHIESIDQENAKRNYDEKTQQNNLDTQKNALINNMVGASLGTFGGAIGAVRQLSKRAKQLKDTLNTRKGVRRLLGNQNEGQEQIPNEDFFKDDNKEFYNSETKVPDEDIFSGIESQRIKPLSTADLFSESTGDIPILESQNARDLRTAQIKSNFRDYLTDMDEGQQQKFINQQLEIDDKPDYYSQTFESSVQRTPVKPQSSIQLTEMKTPDEAPAEQKFYYQTADNVEQRPPVQSTMETSPEHAYVRSNEEILKSGYRKPDVYENEYGRINYSNEPKNFNDGPQIAPQATTEMKPVIGSSGQQVGVSAEGADLSAAAETTESGLTEGLTEGITTAATTAVEGLDIGLETAAVATSAIPVVGEVLGIAGLIGGIATTIGSSIISSDKSQEQQQQIQQTYQKQLTQASNIAGRYTSRTFSSQYMF